MADERAFGAWLKERRKELDFTQAALASLVGCATITIRKLEAGDSSPSREIAQRLAECLQVPSDLHEEFVTSARTGRYPGRYIPRDIRPTNLRAPLTPLIGRERAVRVIRERLMQPGAVLLTLTGPPGVGKTRLSLQAALELLPEFEDGVFFVPLAQVHRLDLVPAAIADVLAISDVGPRSRLTALKDHLRDKQMLLVLDNFEQLVGSATILADLLSLSPYLKLLVTSREALHLRDERQFPVSPLEVPARTEQSVEALRRNPAVQLFVERAQAVEYSFALTEQNAPVLAAICSMLDGLPLALELAAARVKLLSPEEIQVQLSTSGGMEPGRMGWELLSSGVQDRPVRQQTLRRAMDWSYDLLDRGERTLFARLGVFSGRFSLKAAASVCNARNDLPLDTVRGIESLLDKSLLQAEMSESVVRNASLSPGPAAADPTPLAFANERRFRMLETIRHYALQRLGESGEEEEVRRYHAEYCLSLAEEAGPELRGNLQSVWLSRLESEHDNFRAALTWCLGGDAEDGIRVEIGLRLAAALGWFWFIGGHFSEGRNWLATALSTARSMPPDRVWHDAATLRATAHILSSSGRLAMRQGDFAAAQAHFGEGLALWRELEDLRGVAGALSNLGYVALEQGNLPLARSTMEESLASWKQLSDKRGIAEALHGLGIIAGQEGRYDEAAALFEESLALTREQRDHGAVANALQNLAEVMMRRHDYTRAQLLVDESMLLARQHQAKWLVADAQLLNATLASLLGNYERSRTSLAECLPYFLEAGNLLSIAAGLALAAELDCLQSQDRRDAEQPAPSSSSQARLMRAARLLGAAASLQGAARAAILDSDLFRADRTLLLVKSSLDEEAFSTAWYQGQHMTVEQAVGYALGPG